MSVTIRTPKLNGWTKNLKTKVEPSLMYAGQILRGKVVKSWLSGKAPNGTGLKKGNTDYLDWKKGKGMKRQIDFMGLTGKLQQSFTVKKSGKNGILLWFNSLLQRKKAQGLFNKRRNMLRVGKKLRAETVKNFFKRLKFK